MKIIAVMTQKGGVEKTMKMCLCGLSISDSENIRDFSRWQPLPEPYREEQENNSEENE